MISDSLAVVAEDELQITGGQGCTRVVGWRQRLKCIKGCLLHHLLVGSGCYADSQCLRELHHPRPDVSLQINRKEDIQRGAGSVIVIPRAGVSSLPWQDGSDRYY